MNLKLWIFGYLAVLPWAVGIFLGYVATQWKDDMTQRVEDKENGCQARLVQLQAVQLRLNDKPRLEKAYRDADETLDALGRDGSAAAFRSALTEAAAKEGIVIGANNAGETKKPSILGNRWSATTYTIDFTADSVTAGRYLTVLLSRFGMVRITELGAAGSTDGRGLAAWNVQFELLHFK